jgi:hypothetical protein
MNHPRIFIEVEERRQADHALDRFRRSVGSDFAAFGRLSGRVDVARADDERCPAPVLDEF